MIAIDFTEEDIEALDYERYHHPHPRVQRKMEALWLKYQGLPHNQITRLAGISPNTLHGLTCATTKLAALTHSNSSITAHRKVNCWLIRPRLKTIFGQIQQLQLKKQLRQKSITHRYSTQ